MQDAPTPSNETERMVALHRLAILDTKPEKRFDDLTREAVEKFGVPMSMISILDSDREWYKSCQGLEQTQGDRKTSFCGHALLVADTFIVEDTLKDARFKDNPMVVGYPFIRFYAGVALFDQRTMLPIGVFCLKDTKPRQMSAGEVALLLDLAERAEKEINRT